ncbi:MAG: hypothetical protein RMK81_09770 [Geminicoccaceae bacterium]|nr:hypothetical protein [Geminicoccaceae bacterium]
MAAALEEREILPPPVGGRPRIAVLGGISQHPRRVVDRIEQKADRRVQALAFDLEAPEVVTLTGGELGDHDERGDRLALVPERSSTARGLERQAAVGAHVLERAAIGRDPEPEGGVVGDERAPGHDRARGEIGVVVAGGRLLGALRREPIAGALDEPAEPGLDAPAPARGDLRRVADQRPGDDGRQQEAVDGVVGGRVGGRRVEQRLAAGPTIERRDERLARRRHLGREARGTRPHDEPGDRVEPGVGSVPVARADRTGGWPAAQPQIRGGAERFGTGRGDRPAPLDRVDQHDAGPAHQPYRVRGLQPRRTGPLGTAREHEADQEEQRRDRWAPAAGQEGGRAYLDGHA